VLLLLLPYWTRSTPSFAPPHGGRGAGAGLLLLLLLPYWTWSTPSFAPPHGVRGAGAGLLLLLLLPFWTRSTPSFAPPHGGRGAGAGLLLLLLLPYWTRSTPSFAPPHGRRGAGAGLLLLLLLPHWMWSTPSFAPPHNGRGAGAGLLLSYWSPTAAAATLLDETEEQLPARFCTDSAPAPSLSPRVFSPHRGSEFFIPGAPGGSCPGQITYQLLHAKHHNWDGYWGRVLLEVSGAGLVTLLSGGASTRGSATPGRATLQSTGGPRHPADHALVALFAPGADRGAFPSCSSLPCLPVRGQAMLGHGFSRNI